MSVFDCEKEVFKIFNNGAPISYTKEYYPHTNTTYYVLVCPKYLHSTLSSYYKKYGVEVYDDKHICLTNEDGIVEVWNEIKRGRSVYETYHAGQNVSNLHYDAEHQFSIAFIQVDGYDRFMVNHSTKKVSAIHGYMGAGREYAKKMGYNYADVL